MNQDRGFVLKPEEFIIGQKAHNIDEVLEILEKNEKDFSGIQLETAEEMQEVLRTFFDGGMIASKGPFTKGHFKRGIE